MISDLLRPELQKNCVLPRECWELNLGPLQEQPVLLTTELLRPWNRVSYITDESGNWYIHDESGFTQDTETTP